MIRKERKVEEIFEFDGVKLQVVEIGICDSNCREMLFLL